MFRKRKKWAWSTIKALFMAQLLYRCARFFLNAAEKQSSKCPPEKIKKEKK